MNKIILSSILLLLSSSVFSEASIDNKRQDKTFLLTAPGTVTGNNPKQEKTRFNAAVPTFPPGKPAYRQQPYRYKYVGERKKFRQFGQKPGQNNPWFQDYNLGYPRQMSPSAAQPITNPWQLGGMPPLRDISGSGQPPYSSRQSLPYGSESYVASDNLYPDFPDGIYRDTNPAAFSRPGNKNGFMPGLGGDNFNFPFSPFGMF